MLARREDGQHSAASWRTCMLRWLIVSAIYTVGLLLSGKIDAAGAIVFGLFIGAVSIGVLKLFGMDKKG